MVVTVPNFANRCLASVRENGVETARERADIRDYMQLCCHSKRQLPKLHTRVRFPSPAPGLSSYRNHFWHAFGAAGVGISGYKMFGKRTRSPVMVTTLIRISPCRYLVHHISRGVPNRRLAPRQKSQRESGVLVSGMISPVATTWSASAGSGRCSAAASGQGARNQVSHPHSLAE